MPAANEPARRETPRRPTGSERNTVAARAPPRLERQNALDQWSCRTATPPATPCRGDVPGRCARERHPVPSLRSRRSRRESLLKSCATPPASVPNSVRACWPARAALRARFAPARAAGWRVGRCRSMSRRSRLSSIMPNARWTRPPRRHATSKASRLRVSTTTSPQRGKACGATRRSVPSWKSAQPRCL